MPEKKKTEQEANDVQQKLLELRNQMVFSFLMINSIWIVIMFLMQQYKDVLGIKWPLTATVTNIDWNPDDQGGFQPCCELYCNEKRLNRSQN